MCDLPSLLAAMGAEEVEGFPGLRPHQADVVHVFFCYLGAAVLARAGVHDPHQPVEFWRDGLLALSDGDEGAWSLVVDDLSRPAFLQPPLVGKAATGLAVRGCSPSSLDTPITTQCAGVKADRGGSAEDWLFALICSQTSTGYVSGLYGIARMNGGYGSRSVWSLVYPETVSGRWRREVVRLLEVRPSLLVSPWPYRASGRVATWVEPWDGKTALALEDLDPFFIEAARAVRITASGEGFQFSRASTSCQRIAAAALKGAVGDAWTPVVSAESKALAVGKAGFTPALVRDVLFGDGYLMPPMLESSAGAIGVRASVLVRGMGRTDGFHGVEIRVPSRQRGLFRRGAERDRLATLSKRALDDAAAVQKALKPALSVLDGERRWAAWGVGGFASRWSAEFWERLFLVLDETDDAVAQTVWRDWLAGLAREVLAEVVRLAGSSYRLAATSERELAEKLAKVFPTEVCDAN